MPKWMRRSFPILMFLVLSIPGKGQPTDSLSLAPDLAEEWYFHTNDGVQHYVYEIGVGDTIVAIHGGYGAEHSYLLPALEPLSDQYRIIFYDQRGSLRSPAPDSLISLDHFVADLEELRKAAGLEKLALYAHSMGAAIAYAYLKLYPENVRGLILSGPVLPDEFVADTARRRSSERAFVAFAEANAELEKARQGLDKAALDPREWSRSWRIDYASGNIYYIDRWREVKGGMAFYEPRIPRLVYENSSAELLNGGLTALKGQDIPIHIIMGDHDLIDFGAVFWPEIASTMRNTEITVMERAGHNAWIDRPKEYTAVLEEALSRIYKE